MLVFVGCHPRVQDMFNLCKESLLIDDGKQGRPLPVPLEAKRQDKPRRGVYTLAVAFVMKL